MISANMTSSQGKMGIYKCQVYTARAEKISESLHTLTTFKRRIIFLDKWIRHWKLFTSGLHIVDWVDDIAIHLDYLLSTSEGIKIIIYGGPQNLESLCVGLRTKN